MLLHDTGKGGVGGQEKAGARAARALPASGWDWSASGSNWSPGWSNIIW